MSQLPFMMIARLIFILCHISCAAATVGVAHSLDSKSIQSLVYDSLESWLVLYHGAGQDVEPLLKEVAAKISIYGISVGSIDCSKEQKLCNADGIRQHPTAKLMTEKPVFNPYTKKMYRNGEPFVSEILDMKSLEKYIAKSFPSAAIIKVTSEAEFKSNDKIVSTLPTAVLFTEKSVPSLLYRTIALRLKGAMNFVYIPIKASTDLIFKSSTDEMTSAIIGILEPNSDSIQKYTGEDASSREDVLKWLLSFIPEDPSTVTDTPNTSNSQNNNEANKYSSSDFTVDTLSSDIAWIVAVVNQNEGMPATWSEAKKGCQGSIQSAVITCEKKGDDSSSTLSLGQQACKQKDIPYFLTFKHGVAERKKLSNPKFKIESIMSDFESHVEVVRSLGDSLPTSTVKAVYENSLPQFVMDGIGKGLLSIILLTDGTEPSTLFKNVALTYAQNAQFGLITGPSEDMMKRSGITKLPCVIALTPEELSPEIQKNQKDQKGKKGQQEQGLGNKIFNISLTL